MVCAQVIGNDTTVTVAGSQGAFELNAMLPVIARNVMQAIHLMSHAVIVLADKAITDMAADVDALRQSAERSPAVATALNPYLGYDEAASIVKQALAEGRLIRDVVIDRGHLAAGRMTEQQLDGALDALALTRPRG